MRIVIIGSGNVASALSEALVEGGIGPVGIVARSRERAEEIARPLGLVAGSLSEGVPEADLYLLALSDRAIKEVSSQLTLPAEAVVAHTAGSVELEALLAHPHRGVFYPFQTFTKGRKVNFSQIPILIEASDLESRTLLFDLAHRLSEKVYAAGADERRKVHLAGVFACNFVNALYGMGKELVAKAGFDFELLKPLIVETARKASEALEPQKVQTGPAIRGDRPVMERHMELLAEEPLKVSIYKQISEIIWETSKRISHK